MPLMDSFIDLLKKSSLIMKSCQWKSAEEKCREKKVKKKNNRREYSRIWDNYKDVLHTMGLSEEEREKR